MRCFYDVPTTAYPTAADNNNKSVIVSLHNAMPTFTSRQSKRQGVMKRFDKVSGYLINNNVHCLIVSYTFTNLTIAILITKRQKLAQKYFS